jgi:hypothetical protein
VIPVGRSWRFEKLRGRFAPREAARLVTFLELARDVHDSHPMPRMRW